MFFLAILVTSMNEGLRREPQLVSHAVRTALWSKHFNELASKLLVELRNFGPNLK